MCQDDKHSIQVGEPNHPTACLDRVCRVIDHSGLNMTSMDHNFTKAQVVPSMCLMCDIPESVHHHTPDIIILYIALQ